MIWPTATQNAVRASHSEVRDDSPDVAGSRYCSPKSNQPLPARNRPRLGPAARGRRPRKRHAPRLGAILNDNSLRREPTAHHSRSGSTNGAGAPFIRRCRCRRRTARIQPPPSRRVDRHRISPIDLAGPCECSLRALADRLRPSPRDIWHPPSPSSTCTHRARGHEIDQSPRTVALYGRRRGLGLLAGMRIRRCATMRNPACSIRR